MKYTNGKTKGRATTMEAMAKSTWSKRKYRMPKVANTWVKSAGPPPVSKYTELKSPNVQIIDKMVEVK